MYEKRLMFHTINLYLATLSSGCLCTFHVKKCPRIFTGRTYQRQCVTRKSCPKTITQGTIRITISFTNRMHALSDIEYSREYFGRKIRPNKQTSTPAQHGSHQLSANKTASTHDRTNTLKNVVSTHARAP